MSHNNKVGTIQCFRWSVFKRHLIMVIHHLNSQEYTLFWGYFVLEIIVTDSTQSKSAIFWLMCVPAPLECSILERTLVQSFGQG